MSLVQVFGFFFFVLLIAVVFLLSAVTCSCVSAEVEKEQARTHQKRPLKMAFFFTMPQRAFNFHSNFRRRRRRSSARPILQSG